MSARKKSITITLSPTQAEWLRRWAISWLGIDHEAPAWHRIGRAVRRKIEAAQEEG